MSSFSAGGNTVNFTADEEGWSEPATSAVNVRGHPNSNSISISVSGQREVTRTVTCHFSDRGQYVTFALMRGVPDPGSLTIDNWDTDGPVAAVLKEANPHPPRADGEVVAVAQFILA